jgi:hypothetical protein
MTEAESPGAVAARGASKQIDQLGGKVDPDSSLRILTAQPLRLRAGNARYCEHCGAPLRPKRGGRRPKFCDADCRKAPFRARDWVRRYRTPGAGGNVRNRPYVSTSCKDGFAGRTPSIIAPQVVIATEIITGRIWQSAVSPDGVSCEVARVRRGGR